MKVPFINFDYELDLFEKNYESLLIEHVKKGEFIGGESVRSFEENLRNYLNVEHVITVGNGTDALLISLLSLELEKKEVIVPSFSFFATSEAIVQAGLIPIFVDIDSSNCNIDVDKIEEKITPNTGAILPVHLFGNSANMRKILDIAKNYDLKIVEDVAQAFGSKFDKKKLGTIGDIGCFSFHPRKSITTGEGGMVTTNDDLLADMLGSVSSDLEMLEATSFTEDDLIKLINAEVVENEIPKTPKNPKTKLGNIYALGQHKLYCGDTLELHNKITNYSMMWLDPPYGLGGYGGMTIELIG